MMNNWRIKKFITEHKDIINRIYDNEYAGYRLLEKAFAELSIGEIIALIKKISDMDDHSHRYRFKDNDIFEFIVPVIRDFDYYIHRSTITQQMILEYIEGMVQWSGEDEEAAQDTEVSFIKNLEIMLSKDPTIHILELKARVKYDFHSWDKPDADGYSEQKFKLVVPNWISKSDILNKNGHYYYSLKEVLPYALHWATMMDIDKIEVKDIYD